VLTLVLALDSFGLPVVGPPGIPAERLEILRAAFLAMCQDRDYQADAAKLELPVGAPLSGAQLKVLINELAAAATPDVVAAYRRLEAGEATGRGADSDFERELRTRLEAEGLTVDSQVGVAAYRIDLAVRNPSDPTVYLAGIECDGAAFHSAKSARDRDRLRESVLQGLGWDILRVWSTDWFSNPEGQTAKLVDDLFRLAEKPVVPDKLWLPNGSARAGAIAAEPPGAVTAEPPGAVAAESPGTLDPVALPEPVDPGALPAWFDPVVPSNDVGAVEPDAGFQDAVQAPSAIADETGGPAPAVFPAPGRLSEIEVRDALRSFRDEVILKEYPGSEPERCILRDLMISKILEARLDEPEQFDEKIPLWLRERTDQRQIKYLRNVCAIVERMA
jgi:very-short-patch-repair endonuclease